jgi:transcription termination/antitermination protein NusA
MDNLIDVFADFKDETSINREELLFILEAVLKNILKKKYLSENFDVIVNVDKGELEIWRNRIIVTEVENEDEEISLTEAIKVESDFEIGEEFTDEIKIVDFNRREIQSMRQQLIAKIIDYKNDMAFNKYKDLIGEYFIGDIYQKNRSQIVCYDEQGNELVLMKEDQIPGDDRSFNKGDYIKAFISEVNVINGTPIIRLSRTANKFLEILLEQEVPEIYDGLITVKDIARLPGRKAKILVESYDDRIDPVGSVVGMSGNRVRGIVQELNGENIDVVNFTENQSLLVRRLLSPAKVLDIEIDKDKITATLESDQIPLAIGKGGVNIKLANMLVNNEIEIIRKGSDDEEDVDLQLFSDEIDQWIIDTLHKVGFDTAKSVLNRDISDLVKLTDLEEQTVEEIVKILQEEFK